MRVWSTPARLCFHVSCSHKSPPKLSQSTRALGREKEAGKHRKFPTQVVITKHVRYKPDTEQTPKNLYYKRQSKEDKVDFNVEVIKVE